jgi:hypothetical protein
MHLSFLILHFANEVTPFVHLAPVLPIILDLGLSDGGSDGTTVCSLDRSHRIWSEWTSETSRNACRMLRAWTRGVTPSGRDLYLYLYGTLCLLLVCELSSRPL